VACG